MYRKGKGKRVIDPSIWMSPLATINRIFRILNIYLENINREKKSLMLLYTMPYQRRPILLTERNIFFWQGLPSAKWEDELKNIVTFHFSYGKKENLYFEEKKKISKVYWFSIHFGLFDGYFVFLFNVAIAVQVQFVPLSDSIILLPNFVGLVTGFFHSFRLCISAIDFGL